MTRACAAIALFLLLLPIAQAQESLWKLLQTGGQVLFIRHASTQPGVGDPQGFRLDDCGTQRNLSPEGRKEAKRLGDVLRARKVPIGKVVSSPWCRCVETAQLAFGRVDEHWAALGNLFGRGEKGAEQVRAMRPRVADYVGKGNLILVSHGSTARALADVSPQQAEIIVLTPRGAGKFEVAGRLRPGQP